MSNDSKKKILIIYDYFTPAYKAGGPIQSITNMVRLLGEQYDFYVFAKNIDLDGTLLEVESDEWLSFEGKAKVFYASPGNTGYEGFSEIFCNINPDIVYINGLFSFFSTVYPLLFNTIHAKRNRNVIIAPRGMFQEGALALKAIKKKYFLLFMKPLMKRKNIEWHATDEQEKRDIEREIGTKHKITIAGNVPAVVKSIKENNFEGEELRLVTIALVARKKNHLALLEVLRDYKGERKIVYDIYGPVKDGDYWRECLQVIDQMPSNVEVNYKGPVKPLMVASVLSGYHCYVLPTFGENFGHSIYEAMAAGLPLIISDKTPWTDVKRRNAGWIVTLGGKKPLTDALEDLISLSLEELTRKGLVSKTMADDYLKGAGLEERYERLFGRA